MRIIGRRDLGQHDQRDDILRDRAFSSPLLTGIVNQPVPAALSKTPSDSTGTDNFLSRRQRKTSGTIHDVRTKGGVPENPT